MGNGVQDPEAVRNVGLIGHPDAGVTELVHQVQHLDETPVEVLIIYPSGEFLWWED